LNKISFVLNSILSIDSDATAREVKTYAFQSIGLLAQRMPHLFRFGPLSCGHHFYHFFIFIFPFSLEG